MGGEWVVWQLKWGNPYTQPPEGREAILFRMEVDADGPYGKNAPPELLALKKPGDGYAVTWSCKAKQIKALSQEKLAQVRRKRLERRMRKRYPMLAEQFIADELAKKPEYYAGITDPKIEAARNEVMNAERTG